MIRDGKPADFEAIGNRLGFRVDTETEDRFCLVWHGVRFAAFLCLGIALALLVLSIPIAFAIHQRGFSGPAGALWYFPVMNVILLGVALYLLSLKRTIVFDQRARQIRFFKRTLFGRVALKVQYDEVASLRLAIDEVYSGFGVAGSASNESYPVPSLRLALRSGDTILLDRASKRRLDALAEHLSKRLGKEIRREKPTY